MESRELLLKHLVFNDCKGYLGSDGCLHKAIIDALDEALTIGDVIGSLPPKSKFIDLLIENLEHAERDEGVLFSDTLRYNSSYNEIEEFKNMIKEYKNQ